MKDYKDFTDQDIIDGIINDNSKAFLALYYSRTTQLKRLVMNSKGGQSDVDEIEQKSIVILYEKIKDKTFVLNSNTKLSTYLYAIGRNLWFNELKRTNRDVSIEHAALVDFSEDSTSEYRFHAKDKEEELLMNCFDKLGEKCQKILKSKYFNKLSDRDLSFELEGMKEDSIRKKRYKCMQQLKNHFLKLKSMS